MQQYSYIDIKQNRAYFIFEKNPELCFVTFCLMYCKKKKILIKEMVFFISNRNKRSALAKKIFLGIMVSI